MKLLTKHLPMTVFSFLAAVCLSACTGSSQEPGMPQQHTHDGPAEQQEPAKGPNGGRLLSDGDFALELAIFEAGVPPEFRAWATEHGQLIAPERVDLEVRLTRLGNRIDRIGFAPEMDYLRGDTVVYEPHSFVVGIEAAFNGQRYFWGYDNFEGRTTISSHAAEAFGIQTGIAGPALMDETVAVYGRIEVNHEAMREVSARFPGSVQAVRFSIGDTVRQGQTLATIESNESLNSYTIKAPISGVITERNANPGEQTAGRNLFTIIDRSTVWASLSLFPRDRSKIAVGTPVSIAPAIGGQAATGVISRIDILADSDQTVKAIVVLNNDQGRFLPGTYVTAQVKVAEYQAPLAVQRSGLQSFRDFTVVYAKIGEQYEVRMLELGRQNQQWAEVLAGLESGTEYVTENSYIIKADIEKSGASHDH